MVDLLADARVQPKSALLRRFAKIGLVLAVGVAVYLGYRASRPRRINLLIVTLDTTRADRIGCYGYQSGHTPKIDGVAREGLLFVQAYSTVPLTLPSHASIFTGLYPPEHGLRVNGRESLSSEPETLAGLLREQGYSTGAFVSSFVLDKKFGLDRGFQHYDDSRGQEGTQGTGTAAGVTTAALKWLEGQGSSPFFCWVHYIDPHAEYDPHAEVFGDQFVTSAYDGEIAFVDLHIGRILKFLQDRQLDDETLVIIIGDHGEAFGEHGERQHGSLVYNTTMRIPLVMRMPRSRRDEELKFRNRRVKTPVSQVDIFPTALEVLGLKPAQATSGRSLLQSLDAPAESERGIYFESLAMTPRGWAPQYGILRNQWKMVRSPQSELFNLETDADENKNVFGSEPSLVSEMQELLVRTERTFHPRTGQGTELTPAEMARLSAGGYAVSPRLADDSASRSGPDVKIMLPYYYQTIDAEISLPKSPQSAEVAVRKVVLAQPEFEMAWSVLGAALYEQGRLPEAVEALTRAIDLDRNSVRAHGTLGKIHRARNRLAEAESELRLVLRSRPDSSSARIELAEILLERGNTDQAIKELRTAIEIDSKNVAARLVLADAFLKRGELKEAWDQAEFAASLDPQNGMSQLYQGLILDAQGSSEAAIQQLRRTIPLLPAGDARGMVALAEALWKSGQKAEARATIQQALKVTPGSQKAKELLKKFAG